MSFIPKLRVKAILTMVTVVLGAQSGAFAALPATGTSLKTHLKTLPLEPPNLGDFIKDKPAAIALGKALFWDMSVGSDGVQACASCHFSAGADNRAKNQISPGLNRKPMKDTTFSPHGPNYTLKAEDFPLHKLSDPLDRYSSVVRTSNDVVSSQGVASRDFSNVVPGFPIDLTKYLADPDGFNVNGTNTRRVEPRNTPTMINAVLNFRNFWDGRAQNDFNGVNPFGARDPDAFVYKKDASGKLVKTKISLINSSLASQAVGPVLSFEEMSARGRPFAKVGVKLLPMAPLARQLVAADDSVLGPVSRAPNRGLKVASYRDMVKAAFSPDWYNSSEYLRVTGNNVEILSEKAGKASKLKGELTYTQAEYNFSLFFGLAVQMYEATLLSDDTPFDRYLDGDANALTAEQKYGFELFGNNTLAQQGPARCANCHGGPETTDASVFKVAKSIITSGSAAFVNGVGPMRRRFNTTIGMSNIFDMGFNNIGVSATQEDLGLGGNDPFGNPLSNARKAFLNGDDLSALGSSNFPGTTTPIPNTLGVDGAFKIPNLRNVELTAPYFHNGDAKSLEEVVDFYFRGGNFQIAPVASNVKGGDCTPVKTGAYIGYDKDGLNETQIAPLGTLTGANFDNFSPQGVTCVKNPTTNLDEVKITACSTPGCEFPGGALVERDKQALVAFMKALTDDRVKLRKAPFDHPELFVPNGHLGDETVVIDLFGTALDQFTQIPAVGKNGGAQLPKFLGL